MLGVAALAVSFFAVALSAGFAARQILLMRNANYVPVLVDLLGQFRSMEFNDNYLYVCTRLQHEQDPAKGISGLPADVRAKVYDVAYFYQLFAALVALKVVKEQDIVAVLRDRIVHVWQAVAPFVHTERSSTVPTGPFPDAQPRGVRQAGTDNACDHDRTIHAREPARQRRLTFLTHNQKAGLAPQRKTRCVRLAVPVPMSRATRTASGLLTYLSSTA